MTFFLLGLPFLAPRLVHGRRSDTFCIFLGSPFALLFRLFNVLVLALSFRAPFFLWHDVRSTF